MRQTAARLNRTWLTVIGLLLLLTGFGVVAIGAGLLQPLAGTLGLTLDRPAPGQRLAGAATASALELTWVITLLALGGVILALLGLGWLIAQIPRTNQAKPYRLHDSAADGLTRCAPDVITDATETQIKALPDVTAASAVLRGTLAHPDLTVKVTANERTDIPQLLHTLQTRVADDLSDTLDTPLSRLAVQIEIGTTRTKTHQIVL